jgi:hypothetical protein
MYLERRIRASSTLRAMLACRAGCLTQRAHLTAAHNPFRIQVHGSGPT